MAIAKNARAAVQQGINFLDLSMYASAGFGIPEGYYALEFTVMNYQPEKKDGTRIGESRLGIMVKAHSLQDVSKQGDGAYSQHYSMGTNADKMYSPDPDTGKRLIPIPGAAQGPLQKLTNWEVLLKSLFSCGLTPEALGGKLDDVSPLDGVWVHMRPEPEPEERKGFRAKTGEQAMLAGQQGQQADKGVQMIAVVTEILEGGAPWEGGGGIPENEVVPIPGLGAPAVAAPAKVAPITKGKAVPAATVAAAAAPAGDDELHTAGLNAFASVLEKDKEGKGMPKAKFRTEVFKVGGANGEAIVNTYFADDATLNALLAECGYMAEGIFIKPQ